MSETGEDTKLGGWLRFWPLFSFALLTISSVSVAYGQAQSQIAALEDRQDRFEAVTKEQLNELRLGVNRIDDRTREQFKAMSEVLYEIKGKLEK